jgi:hypothetical protein
MKYLITENQLKLIKKYMGNFINEETSDDDDRYERRREKGDIDTYPDSDGDDGEKAKSLTIYYMSRENMLSMKNNSDLEEDDFSVRVDLNFLANNDGEALKALAITDYEGVILRNSNDIMNSLSIGAPQNMKNQQMEITNMLRQKVASNTFIEYISKLIKNNKVDKYVELVKNKKVAKNDDEITAYVVINKI